MTIGSTGAGVSRPASGGVASDTPRSTGTEPSRTEARREKAEQVRRTIDASLDRLAQALDAGQSEEMQAFLKAMGRFHQYSFQNVMLILSQRPDASRVAGFHTWKSLGRSVKKGEKGIAIFAPMMLKKDKSESSLESESDSNSEKVLRFRVVHVFDLSQTEGEDLPEPSRITGDPGELLARLQQAIKQAGIELVESDHLGGACGTSFGGRIEVRADLAPGEKFATLVHEYAHELLHQGPDAKRGTKTVRETEAEAVAHAVCEAAGLPSASAAADYIGLYAGDREVLVASLDRIQKAASQIIGQLFDEAEAAVRRTVAQPSRMERTR